MSEFEQTRSGYWEGRISATVPTDEGPYTNNQFIKVTTTRAGLDAYLESLNLINPPYILEYLQSDAPSRKLFVPYMSMPTRMEWSGYRISIQDRYLLDHCDMPDRFAVLSYWRFLEKKIALTEECNCSDCVEERGSNSGLHNWSPLILFTNV